VVHILAGGVTGLEYGYADGTPAQLIRDLLAPKIVDYDALAIGGCWIKMVEQIRNLGRPGIASMAITAVDNALWDLKGKLVNVSVTGLLGLVRGLKDSISREILTGLEAAKIGIASSTYDLVGLPPIRVEVGGKETLKAG